MINITRVLFKCDQIFKRFVNIAGNELFCAGTEKLI